MFLSRNKKSNVYPCQPQFYFMKVNQSMTSWDLGRAAVCVCGSPWMFLFITKTHLFKYTESFTTKKWQFFTKKNDIFHISAQNIDCGYSLEPPRRGGSNKYPQSMFLSRNNKINVYSCKPQFYYIKVGFKGVSII